MKKDEKPFWIEVEDEGTFADIFDSDLFDKDCQNRAHQQNNIDVQVKGHGSRRKIGAPQKELDLHSCTGQEAESRVKSFILAAQYEKLHVLRIITGKGLHSDGPPVLPDVVEQKMYELKEQKLIRNFFWEKKRKSFSGALIILL